MLMEREMRKVNGRHDFTVCESISISSSLSNGLSSGNAVPVFSSYGATYIEHPVSKLDTLAGVAIKYGVEVADIKKMNGLVTDLQMFGLKKLKIPLPGRHPPSPCLSNGHSTSPGQKCSERAQTPNRVTPRDLSESLQSLRVKTPQRKVSPAMSSLQGYYRLKLPELQSASEGFEMAVYRKGSSESVEDGPISESSPHSEPTLGQNLKSRHLINSLSDENGERVNFRSPENFVSQRHSSVDFSKTSDVLLKEDSSSSGGFLSKAGKGLALRPKSASKAALASDNERGGLNPISINLEESICPNGVDGVRKSLSTSSLQDQENGSSSSIWSASKWSLKQDLQALSAVAMVRPIFDGLPKPIMTGRRNKAQSRTISHLLRVGREQAIDSVFQITSISLGQVFQIVPAPDLLLLILGYEYLC